MSNKGGETKRNPATMKPANVIHFLEKILKMKRESKLKTGNRNKSRPNQVVTARRPFKEGKKKLSGVKKKNKKEDFTKAEALQKLFDIAGDDWDLNKEDFSQSAFHCPKEDGEYGDPGNCAFYYRCVHGEAERKMCSQGLLWDERKRRCDWGYVVVCR